MNLRRGEPGALRINQGFDHVIDQMVDFGRRGVGDFPRALPQNGVAHAGDFQQCHGRNIGWRSAQVKVFCRIECEIR